MCVISFVGDHYTEKWRDRDWNGWWTIPYNPQTPVIPLTFPTTIPNAVSREEFDALLAEVLEMKELLKKALKYDQDNGEPDCYMDEKVAALKKVAELVGVDLSEVFGK